jgi:hypothetical protein
MNPSLDSWRAAEQEWRVLAEAPQPPRPRSTDRDWHLLVRAENSSDPAPKRDRADRRLWVVAGLLTALAAVVLGLLTVLTVQPLAQPPPQVAAAPVAAAPVAVAPTAPAPAVLAPAPAAPEPKAHPAHKHASKHHSKHARRSAHRR